jgi:O-antigen/teichoic acid export membrane protein
VKNSSGSLISNGVWSLLSQAVRVGSLALMMIALSRHFGPQRFGSLAVALAIVRIFAAVGIFGLDRIVVRHLVDQNGLGGSIIYEGFWLKLSIAAVSYVTMIGLIFTCARGDMLLLLVAMVAGIGLLFQAADVFDYAFQAQGAFRLSFLGRAVPILLSTGVKLSAVVLDAPLLWFAALETIEAAAIAAALYFLYRRTVTHRTRPILRRSVLWQRLLGEGFPLVLAGLAIMIYMRSDVIMLGKMMGYGAAGIYAAASQISEACALLPGALIPTLFPVLLRSRNAGPVPYRRNLERLFVIAVVTGLVLSLGISITASPIIELVYGANFSAAANVLVIHGWTIPFMFLAITQNAYDVAERLAWFATFRMVAGALLNITLNLFLIPRYGLAGSAVATLIAQLFSAVLLNAIHPQTRPILRMQLRAMLLWPAWRALARSRQSGEHRSLAPC